MERKKHKRKTNPSLLRAVSREPCCIDGCSYRAQAAHIKSRGAMGDDVATNLAPLCWLHHTEQHTLGWPRFRNRHPEVKSMADLHREYHPCHGCIGTDGECTSAYEIGLKECEGYEACPY